MRTVPAEFVPAGGADAAGPAEADLRFMELALALGRRGLGNTWPNPAVGAIVVRDEGEGPVIVGRGFTRPGGRPHAETEALRQAGAAARGATLYVTLEPCAHHGRTPPCAEAIVAAGIRRVVSALEDPNPAVAGRGHAVLRRAGIAVEIGVGAAAARRVHAGHLRRVQDGRPHVTLKLAVSADGKAGLAGRRPAAITGEAARARAHLMRAHADAILVGIGTALADDPLLTCRLPGLEARSPVRIVLDTALRLPLSSRLARSAPHVPLWLIAAADGGAEREAGLRQCGVEVIRLPASDGRLDLAAVMRCLGGRGVTRLLVEGGPIVAAALLQAGLVDCVALFHAPNRIGAEGIDALGELPLATLTQSPHWRELACERIGADALHLFERA